MSLRKVKVVVLKKQKPISWKYWISSDKFFFEIKGPLGSVLDSIPNTGIIHSVSDDSFFFINYSIYIFFLSKVQNNIAGVCYGYYFDMFYKGLGYRAWVYSSSLYSNLGYSHVIKYDFPKSVVAKARKNQLLFFSVDLSLLNSVATSLTKLKLPDPYRGKGVRFVDVDFVIKPGKQR
jgi:large subunit ribosomal protein L6